MKLDSRHILILLGLSLALSSCVQFSAQEGMGQLYPPVFEVDASVEDLAQTKAAAPALPTFDAPALSQVHFTVKDKDGKVVYDKTGVWDSPLQLPVGAYSIDAYSGSNKFGSAYFTGTASGTVAGGQEETPSITMVLQNALLAVGLTENLAQHFTVAGENCIRISTASASIDTGKDEYIYVPSGEALSIAISGTSSAGVAKTITHSLTARSAATATYLSCDMTTTNAPVITMSSKDDDYGAWGTVAYIPFASTQNINKDNAAKMEYWASSDGINFGIKGEIVKGVNVKFTGLETGKKYSFCAKVGNIVSDIKELTVAPMPSIVVTATGTTSYDYYLAYKKTGDSSKLEQANNTVPETVSGIGYSVSGIDDKLKQAKFGYRETLKYDTLTVSKDTTMVKQSWRKHIVSATVTFAGQTFNGYKDCHVTGLPYRAPSVHKFNESTISWQNKASASSTKINSDNIHLEGAFEKPSACSPTFFIPEAIKVTINQDVKKNSFGSNYTYTLLLYNGSNDGDAIVNSDKNGSLNKGGTKNYINETQLTSNYNQLIAKYSYGATSNYVEITKFEITYSK